MPIVINQKYKEIVQRISAYTNMTPLQKAALALEEMDTAKEPDEDGVLVSVFDDYTTIAKTVIEVYLGKEIDEDI